MEFAAKVDTWFLALFGGLGLLMLLGAPLFHRKIGKAPAAVLLAVIGVLFIGVAWRASAVSFLLTPDGHLDVLGWPHAGRIAPVGEIHSVVFSNDPRASLAASLDRLRIDYGEHGLIFIAVEDEDGFLAALSAMDPGLVRTQDGLRRGTARRGAREPRR